MKAYQNATGLTDGEIDSIRQKLEIRYFENIRFAQYAYNNGHMKGLVSPLVWNDEIMNIGIGKGLSPC